MLQFLLRFILLQLCVSSAYAQLPYQFIGARAAGMGGAAVPVTDVWALHYNTAALAGVQEPLLAVGYQTRFHLPELSTAAVIAAWPMQIGVAGASFSRYGFGPFHITEGSIGFARQIQLVSLGLQLGFVQFATKGFGSSTAPLLSFGGTAQLLPQLRFGGSVYNITQTRLQEETGEHLPTLLKAGLQWQPTELLLMVVETEKDVDYPARFKTGLEYKIHKLLALRTGISTREISLHGGLGFYPGKLRFNYAMQHHEQLGLMHHVSFSIQPRKQE